MVENKTNLYKSGANMSASHEEVNAKVMQGAIAISVSNKLHFYLQNGIGVVYNLNTA